jgi:4-hydroxy-tetrahydrodipicolinate synthase
MPALELYCRTATTFAPDGALDEDAFRKYLQRFVDARIGVYLASAGSGESGAMTAEELRRVYRIGVDACKGKIPVHGNPPEKLSVRETLDHIRLAIEGGVEIVNVYGPAGWHGFQPTSEEIFAFFAQLLADVKHPVSISPNPNVGRVTPSTLAALCRKHGQIVAINLADQNDDYFIELKDTLARDVAINVGLTGSLEMLQLGASGVIGAEPNALPRTYRRYLDLVEAGNMAEAAAVYADLKRFIRYVAKWRGSHPRYLKMMMRVFGIRGWGLRSPYVMPTDEERQEFTAGLLRLRLPEIDDLARAAGISPP